MSMDTVSSNKDIATLATWFRSIRVRNVDLVGDFAGKELFVVHGEGLLLHCLAEDKVDLHEGFQILHAIFAVEKFLSRLEQRGCSFDIAFFDNFSDTYPSSVARGCEEEPCMAEIDRYKLVRSVVIQHLERHCTAAATSGESKATCHKTSVAVYEALDSERFQDYLRSNAIHFFFCHEGFKECSNAKIEINTALRYLMYRLVSRGYHIAFLNDVSFQSSKIFANLLGASNGSLPNLDISLRKHLNRRGDDRAFTLLFEAVRDRIQENTELQETPLSARELIMVLSLAHMLPSTSDKNLILSMLVHTVILSASELNQRLCVGTMRQSTTFLDNFAHAALHILEWLSQNEALTERHWDLHDLVDGRLFHAVASCSVDELDLSAAVLGRVMLLAQCVGGDLCTDALTIANGSSPDDTLLCLPKKTVDKMSTSVLPFSQPIFDRHLAAVRIETASSEAPTPARSAIVFQELTHWHNQRPLETEKIQQPQTSWHLKRHQWHMRDMTAYAASLASPSGKAISPEVIIAGQTSSKAPIKIQNRNIQRSHKQIQQKTGGRAAALESARRISERKSMAHESVISNHWNTTMRNLLDEETDLIDRYLKGSKYLAGLSTDALGVIGSDIHLYLCDVLVSLVQKKKFAGAKQPYRGYDILALAWSHMRQTSRANMSDSSASAQPSNSQTVGSSSESEQISWLREKLASLLDGEETPMSPKVFQLMHGGPYMDSNFDSQPDARVPFNPDAWQRKVLDAIDEDKSLLVVAPTSAGKTFISFYAMKKVMTASDDSVLVYVAPTKALVNQIAAEVSARFSKNFKQGASRSVWAIHTRDYRINDSKGCQILITVPHVLQIMLLSPNNASPERSSPAWSRRIKRIIFDEVHCIGQSEDGIVWEQLLLLSPCPIIALSATVGNAPDFRDWLAEAQRQKGFDLEMVVHSTRYSDLRKAIYCPPQDSDFTASILEKKHRLPIPGLDQGSLELSDRFCPVHPISALLDCNRGNLEDINLEPRDCYTLWRCMRLNQTSRYSLPGALHPERCLPGIVSKSDVAHWERNLKDTLQLWMKSPESPFRAMQAALLGGEKFRKLKHNLGSMRKDEAARPTIISVVYDLHELKSLPAIIFNHDRSLCEQGLHTILDHLEKSENEWKQSDEEWQAKLKRYEAWQRFQMRSKDTKQKQGRKKSRGKASRDENLDTEDKVSKNDRARDEADFEMSQWASFDPDAPLDIFSFGNRAKLAQTEFDEMTCGVHVDDRILKALRRGVGVHHSGMNRRYRQIVEMLFRRGYLGVVIATGTLALGINMPCKTVVFYGDSVFLTALNYRQASGRAGRRGFDRLGNVVFADIAPERVFEIISSRLPDLKGQFSISTTLILRLLTLLHGTNNTDIAVAATDSLLAQTRTYLGGYEAKAAVLHHVRFSIEYLRRQHLVSKDGAPLNFCGLVSHLYYAENSAFAFHALLKSGYFHKLCVNIRTNQRGDILQELVLTMAHLFVRQPIHRGMMDHLLKSNIIGRSPSVVFLPRLPIEARKILTEHDEETLNMFKGYVRTYISQHLQDEPDLHLPFSGIRVAPRSEDLSEAGHTTLPNRLLLTAPEIRSPFAALSGHSDDTIDSIHDLCATVRAGVFLEELAIPHVPVSSGDAVATHRGHGDVEELKLNAYLYDFFKHGDVTALKRDNRIRPGDLWYLLKGFSLVLATIVTSLGCFIRAGGAMEYADEEEMFQAMDGLEEDDRRKDEEALEVSASQSILRTEASTNSASEKKKKTLMEGKKATRGILNSWEDSEESGDDVVCVNDETADDWDYASTSNGLSGDDSENGQSLTKVLLAFTLLRKEFDTKLQNIGA